MSMASEIRAALSEARSVFSGAVVKVRHEKTGAVYEGLRGPLGGGQEISGMGAIDESSGQVRIDCQGMQEPHPKAGDKCAVKESEQAGFIDRVVTGVRYDPERATMLVQYGAKYQ